jgi:hypothetical protein
MNSQEVLNFFSKMTSNTDPGDLRYFFDDIPSELEPLCHLIKCQLIHPDMVEKFRHLLTNYTKREDRDFCSVREMLESLLERNANGIIFEREACQRLIVSCRYHSLLLISMLRSKGRPARCRVGFARYLSPIHNKYYDHWICEVWNQKEERWMLVDPDQEMIDIQEDFLPAGDAWLMARNKEINPKLFGVKKSWGFFYIRNNLCHDLNAVLGHELRYWDFPPICKKEMNELDFEEMQLLDEVAVYLQDPDQNFDLLQSLFLNNECLQFK